jgi:hypothetical protein
MVRDRILWFWILNSSQISQLLVREVEKVESSLLGHRVKKVKINSREFEMDLNKRKNHKAIQLKSNKTNKLNILRILKLLSEI